MLLSNLSFISHSETVMTKQPDGLLLHFCYAKDEQQALLVLRSLKHNTTRAA
jgi:hypothetical protein